MATGVEELVDMLFDMIDEAKNAAFGGGKCVIERDKALDLLESSFPMCDTERVLITGNSGGGTASFYSACYDERIGLCAPSCALCSYEPS